VSLGPSEIIVVLLVALVVLGPDKLPAAARTFGKYLAEFRKFSASVQAQVDQALQVPDTDAAKPKPPGETNDASGDYDDSQPKPANPDTSGFSLIDEKQPEPGASEDS
jgi:sec-independent protein translocase protein TatA